MTTTDRSIDETPHVVCAWCGLVMSTGDPDGLVSHGICLACCETSGAFDVERVADAPADVLDRLPFGVVRLSADGTVLAYNAPEARLSGLRPENVIGRNFFREIAPCTGVQEFEGAFRAMCAAGRSARVELDFVFVFPAGRARVEIALVYDEARQSGAALIRQIGP